MQTVRKASALHCAGDRKSTPVGNGQADGVRPADAVQGSSSGAADMPTATKRKTAWSYRHFGRLSKEVDRVAPEQEIDRIPDDASILVKRQRSRFLRWLKVRRFDTKSCSSSSQQEHVVRSEDLKQQDKAEGVFGKSYAPPQREITAGDQMPPWPEVLEGGETALHPRVPQGDACQENEMFPQLESHEEEEMATCKKVPKDMKMPPHLVVPVEGKIAPQTEISDEGKVVPQPKGNMPAQQNLQDQIFPPVDDRGEKNIGVQLDIHEKELSSELGLPGNDNSPPQQRVRALPKEVTKENKEPPYLKVPKENTPPLHTKLLQEDKLLSGKKIPQDEAVPPQQETLDRINVAHRWELTPLNTSVIDNWFSETKILKVPEDGPMLLLQADVQEGNKMITGPEDPIDHKIPPRLKLPEEIRTPPKPKALKKNKLPVQLKIPKEEKVPPKPTVCQGEDSADAHHMHFQSLGFPNPEQFCYMNSSLQSLLTLKEFVQDIICQQDVWSSSPEATLIRALMDIQHSHNSSDLCLKASLLLQFKNEVSTCAPEFEDLDQKDAHEFLTSVLEQMRSLSPRLQKTAASMGKTYSCPVENHLVFKMKITRICRGCGEGSYRVEEFTNLSLDMMPGGRTVEQMLEDYLKEKRLEYRCECGAGNSGLCSSFVTLPRVLVLHLKRFQFTKGYKLKKVKDEVKIVRDLVVTSSQGGASYSLISTINHIGRSAKSGHYISDGADPESRALDQSNRWFTYDDDEVTETSGTCVVDLRGKNAYILFYRRRKSNDGEGRCPLITRSKGSS